MLNYAADDLAKGLTEAQQADIAHAAETETELKRKFPAVADVAEVVTNLLLGALLLPVHLHLGICDVLISAGLSNRLASESDQHALLKLIYACEVPCLRTPPSPKAV